ncbi:DUF6264 family protein [Microbacterium sp. W4I20]|uniref:DUF6264 family protein n=1 Tax=Microbacterium sp. W4I20 TaxID=3042262 RepID=UPI002785EE52|nr:DUF6264 family protein [Microbacterium sp. W4I20]MDQ0729204.1 uncharacterized BrkB/YihY/UPF0761 family membrane protein [Microbacterium sp. W4I20]
MPDPFAPPAVGHGAQRRPVRVGDVVASSILLIAGFIGFAMLAFVSLFLAMVSDGCGSGTNCDFGVMTAGYYLALVAPPLIFIAAAIWTIIRLIRRRPAWWLPLVGSVAALAAWGIGAGMMQASLGR